MDQNFEYIKVYIRDRLNDNSKPTNSSISKNHIKKTNNQSCTYNDIRNKYQESFSCEQYFDSTTKQEDLYDIVAKPIVTSALLGYSGTILAYGPTSSGKTFTMRGGEEDSTKGIIPRFVYTTDIVDHI